MNGPLELQLFYHHKEQGKKQVLKKEILNPD